MATTRATRRPTRPTPTVTAAGTTTRATTTPRAGTGRAGAAGAAGAASPDLVKTVIPDHPTTRPTQWCTNARARNRARAARVTPTRSRASAALTRLEAKRQRRRDGRDAGRRRPPILSEAEFLARREAVERTMIVRDKVRTEPRTRGPLHADRRARGRRRGRALRDLGGLGIPGGQHLPRHRAERPAVHGGGVRRHRRGRNGVLYAGEVNWEAAGLGGAQRKIEQALKPGDYVVVQVSKDPVGHKGARLTTQVSLAGRYLVYVPGASSTGISRKLPGHRTPAAWRDPARGRPGRRRCHHPHRVGGRGRGHPRRCVAAAGTLDRDRRQGQGDHREEGRRRRCLYEEPDVLVKVIRDLFNEDFSSLDRVRRQTPGTPSMNT